MAVNKELMKGSTVTLVLTLLARKKMYGYELINELGVLSDGVFELKEGTLYPILHGLEKEGSVEPSWVGEEGTRKRKYYSLTKSGRAQLKSKKKEWQEFKSVVDKVVHA